MHGVSPARKGKLMNRFVPAINKQLSLHQHIPFDSSDFINSKPQPLNPPPQSPKTRLHRPNMSRRHLEPPALQAIPSSAFGFHARLEKPELALDFDMLFTGYLVSSTEGGEGPLTYPTGAAGPGATETVRGDSQFDVGVPEILLLGVEVGEESLESLWL
ncbi:hypothetical protein KC343_g7762 [Hortaea werneckii]|nr:hypothetical protein KC352_g15450 [Hortaea werneckii]KAI7562993.1 hypothetical protein KC317_g8040 [Hortaea werneckii]KAI7612836.1 hypothetical protein KC346_g7618 [Hortaea werneckii]KAI7622101.1 hypothetical protein KC343_g7762 [Hortaea werneckii]KAI7663743.1 hypothetical protein KC319_g7646 [Hortaea werneckii]